MTQQKLAILGVGTAGITTACHFLAFLPENWQVFSIYDPNTPILGIGESTTTAIPTQLYNGTQFTLLKDHTELDATLKNGVKYTGWRDHDFFSNLIPPCHGIHFNNFKLKEFAFSRFENLWKDKFQVLLGKIDNIINLPNKAVVEIDTNKYDFDYVIDCRGYPEDYTEYNISENIPVNHCLVHMKPEPGDWNWTYHVAHRNGWMFGIPLTTRQGWGYLYNDKITSRDDAVDDLCERFDLTKDKAEFREFSFKNYYAKEFITGRVIKNGNRALFYEPIEAMSGFFYDQVNRHLLDHLLGNLSQHYMNQELTRIAEDMETFICYIYHGGSTYNSDFWSKTKENTTKKIQIDQRFNWYIELLSDLTPSIKSEQRLFGVFNSPNWLDFDRNLGYNYIRNNPDPFST